MQRLNRRLGAIAWCCLCMAAPAHAAQNIVTGTDAAGGGPSSQVKRFDTPSLVETASFFPFPGFAGGARVAFNDVTVDAVDDFVVGTGPGVPAEVRVFDDVTLSIVRDFLPYGAGFTGGVFVAAADFNADGKADIITGAGSGGTPQVKAFSGANLVVLANFLAFAPCFTGGVRVAAGRVNADLVPDFVVGTGPGGAEVRAFDGQTQAQLHDFLPYGAVTPGVFVAAPPTQGVVPVRLLDFVVD